MLIGDFFASVDAVFISFFSTGASRVALSVRPIFDTLVTLYVVLWGLAMWRGLIAEPMSDAVTRIVKIVVIGTLALNAGIYSPQIAQTIFHTPDQLAGVLIPGASTTSTGSSLDQALQQGTAVGQRFTDAMTLTSPLISLGLLVQAILVWVFTMVLVGYAAALVLLSKVGLSIVLALGPLFIAALLFESTRQLFVSWLSQALNSLFTYVVAVAIVALGMTFFQAAANASLAAVNAAAPQFTATFPLFIVGLAITVTLFQSGAIASALANGIQIGTLGAVGWAMARGQALASSPITAYQAGRAMQDRRLTRDYQRKLLGLQPTLTTRSLQWVRSRIRGTNQVESTR
jgi:type IV secretion system protein VirB6